MDLIKFIVVGLLIATLVTVIVTVEVNPNAQYIITTANDTYYVESYTKENDGKCVYMAENETRFCGDYSVKKINKTE